MIDLSRVPEDIRRQVADARSFTEAEWNSITSDWPRKLKLVAIMFRRLGDEGRLEKLEKKPAEVEKLRALCEDMDSKVFLMVMYLEDAQLDRMIAGFEPDVLHEAGYLS